jgi:hypothetical protein
VFNYSRSIWDHFFKDPKMFNLSHSQSAPKTDIFSFFRGLISGMHLLNLRKQTDFSYLCWQNSITAKFLAYVPITSLPQAKA